jgi:nucleotide-binding universal stress UspA family protein
MSYATLLVYTEADHASEERLRLAARLADKFSSLLIGFSALAPRPPPRAESSAMVEMLEAESKAITAKLSERGNWFRRVAAGDQARREWRWAVDRPTEALARHARCADLVVAGRSRGGDAYNALDLGGFLLRAGRPVLVVPEGVAALRADHIVIGWKDTREARRAVQDALPFLHEATRVTIVEICKSGEEQAAQENIDDVARYLGRHRIKSGPKVTLHEKGSEADQLIRLARDDGADLLVTGAYGHSRLGELIFGGMTHKLVTESPICCLMSH